MINERALEYLLLANVEKKAGIKDKIGINGKVYSMGKVRKRLAEIEQEFLEPYVIDSDSKE